MKLKNALDVPISSKDRSAVKLARRKAKTPYSSGPSPLAIRIPVANERTDFKTFEIKE